MKTLAAAEVTAQLLALLDEVARGEEITITRDGAPVARLVPVPPGADSIERDQERIREAIEAIRQFRKTHHATAAEIREWINDGRKY